MAVTFSLAPDDYHLAERAVAARFEREQGRLNVAFLAQVLAWMFISLAVFTFFKQWERTPDTARGYGVIRREAIMECVEDERNHYLFVSGLHAIVIPKASAAALGAAFPAFLAGPSSGSASGR